jgi:hypothetical protein
MAGFEISWAIFPGRKTPGLVSLWESRVNAADETDASPCNLNCNQFGLLRWIAQIVANPYYLPVERSPRPSNRHHSVNQIQEHGEIGINAR